MILDDGSEAMNSSDLAPRRRVFGCLGLLAGLALTSTVLQADCEGGQVEIDGKVADIPSARVDMQVGVTLADLSEAYTTHVAYLLPSTGGVYTTVVDGAVALTSAGAAKVTDAAITAALPSGAVWVRLKEVLFARSGSVVTAEIDRSGRPHGVDPADKAVSNPATSGSGALYRWVGRMLLWEGLAATIADGDLLTDMPCPLIHGRFSNLHAVAVKAISTGAKTTSLNLEIGTTNVTGTLVYASTKALGVVGSQALSGSNTFVPGDVFSLEAASTTAFTEGEIAIYADVEELIA